MDDGSIPLWHGLILKRIAAIDEIALYRGKYLIYERKISTAQQYRQSPFGNEIYSASAAGTRTSFDSDLSPCAP